MPLNGEPKYPSRRTYVVKVRSDAKPDALAGRLENMTGRQSEFASGRELLASIAGDLEGSGDQRFVDGTGSDRPKRPNER